ncbi:hypothetical protein Lepto7376_0358 [[Leptolyngbya] sp. PCC 7376]|uniref:hypothetical protein n=1 Tax=[Leptolyngbya] sp. PCC 7376 TaxID=111781 RepID=UPI00029F06B2|nr:hypothetical protein [[Leptolyngbya] sp. PCC 7376]AFY36797.1 hypothetical protein Lepto7376_0358 [[Leptolyngbya] sp. PCC 7376]
MSFSPQLMKAVETLQYRATVGEVASQAGLSVQLAQNQLASLASEAGGNLQVAETGDIIYEFPSNFRSILSSKSFKLRLKAPLDKVWQAVFYIIRISFGVALVASIAIMTIAILALIFAANSRDDNNNSRSRGGGIPTTWLIWWGPDLFRMFTPGYYRRGYGRSPQLRVQTAGNSQDSEMNFLESVFSFLFGDGDPNPNLEDRRWQSIGQVIQNNDGAVIAEQIAPYFDDLDSIAEENHMMAVMARFNGYPEVSPEGELIYYFPELQVKAKERRKQSVPIFLEENRWTFTLAPVNQKFLAIGLGGVNLVLALVLGTMLQDPAVVAQIGGFIGLVSALYPALIAYAIAFLTVPLVRYFWIQRRNGKLQARNSQRKATASVLAEGYPPMQKKLKYAQQFAAQKVIRETDIAYGTDRDLLDQTLDNQATLDADWQKRLES